VQRAHALIPIGNGIGRVDELLVNQAARSIALVELVSTYDACRVEQSPVDPRKCDHALSPLAIELLVDDVLVPAVLADSRQALAPEALNPLGAPHVDDADVRCAIDGVVGEYDFPILRRHRGHVAGELRALTRRYRQRAVREDDPLSRALGGTVLQHFEFLGDTREVVFSLSDMHHERLDLNRTNVEMLS